MFLDVLQCWDFLARNKYLSPLQACTYLLNHPHVFIYFNGFQSLMIFDTGREGTAVLICLAGKPWKTGGFNNLIMKTTVCWSGRAWWDGWENISRRDGTARWLVFSWRAGTEHCCFARLEGTAHFVLYQTGRYILYFFVRTERSWLLFWWLCSWLYGAVSCWFRLLLMSVVLVVLVHRPHPGTGIDHGGDAGGDSGGLFGVCCVVSCVSRARFV